MLNKRFLIIMVTILLTVVASLWGPSVLVLGGSYAEGGFIRQGFPIAYVVEFDAMRPVETVPAKRINRIDYLAGNFVFNALFFGVISTLALKRKTKKSVNSGPEQNQSGD